MECHRFGILWNLSKLKLLFFSNFCHMFSQDLYISTYSFLNLLKMPEINWCCVLWRIVLHDQTIIYNCNRTQRVI